MTLVPAEESGNKTIRTLDERRVYEVVGSSTSDRAMTDFEGREITRAGNTLKISGEKKAHVIVRWKFVSPHAASVNGASLKLQGGG